MGNIGDRIKKYRKEAGLTQSALAKKMHVTQSLIGQWEKGYRNPKLENILKISDVLGVPVDCFIVDKSQESQLYDAIFNPSPVTSFYDQDEYIRNLYTMIIDSPKDKRDVYYKILNKLIEFNLAGLLEINDFLNIMSKVSDYLEPVKEPDL